MKFDWKKVIFKDYSTMCSTLVFLACIQLWEVLANHGPVGRETEIYSLAGGVLATSLTALAVRSIKKSLRPAVLEQAPDVSNQ